MFVYDLLTNKHAITSRSLTPILDGAMHLDDPNSIVSKWVRYINEYDKTEAPMRTLSELNKIPDLKTKFGTDAKSNDRMIPDGTDAMMDFDLDPNIPIQQTRHLAGFVKPDVLPLFVKLDNFGVQTILHRNDL